MWRETNVLQEWEVFTFTDVVEVNPKRSLKKGEECQYIEMKSLLPNHRKVEKIDKRAYKGGGSRFRNGDTLFARITPCLENGKIAFINELDPDHAGYGSTEFIVMSGKEGVTDNLFVYYLSRWDKIRDFAIKNMTGTSGRQRVPNDIFKQKKLYFPPLPEQHRIATLLSAFDDKIELNNQMNRTLEEMASAIFKSWFVDFEPFHEGEFEYNEGLDKEIPKGWEVANVDELCESIVNGGTPRREVKEYWDDGTVPWIKTGELIDSVIIDSEEKITESGVKNSSAKKLPINTVLIALYASPTVGQLGILKIPATTNQACSTLIAKKEVGYIFLYYTLRFQRGHLHQIAVGSAQQNISQKIVRDLRVLFPPKEILVDFNKLVGSFYDKITENSLESKTLAKIRDSLLPKLLSGEIRVFENQKIKK